MTTVRPARLADETALDLYRKMIEIRLFEKRAYDLFLQNLVKGTSHLGIGQEAVAAGVSAAMTEGDYTFVTYRGHAHVLARGTPMTPVLAELLGRENGLMHGKGGSMHLLDVSRGVLGAYAIVGAQLVIANGAAWSAQYRGSGQVTVCFLGDGATNIGAFHEALNLAAVWGLPVVFICENNQYMEYTPIGSVTAVPRPGRRPRARLRPGAPGGGRQRRRGGLLLRAERDHGGARGRRPGADRGAHLPARRSLPGRPRQVPPRRGGRAVAGPRSGARLPHGAASSAGSPSRTSTRSTSGPGRPWTGPPRRPRPARCRSPGWPRPTCGATAAAVGGTDPMSVEVIMPQMGETVLEGTVNTWHRSAGDEVTEGEPLLEIGTDKVDTDLPAPASGTLAEIRVGEGETVPVSTVLAIIVPNGAS